MQCTFFHRIRCWALSWYCLRTLKIATPGSNPCLSSRTVLVQTHFCQSWKPCFVRGLWSGSNIRKGKQSYIKLIIQGVSLILTLLKCKISGQKISNFFQTKLFFIVNFRTFCVVKTKFKNIYFKRGWVKHLVVIKLFLVGFNNIMYPKLKSQTHTWSKNILISN